MTDLDGVSFIRRGTHLVAADQRADEFLARIKDGREILVSIRRARNAKHTRLLFAALRKVIDNTDRWASENELLDDLKLAMGYSETRINLITGMPYMKAKSINFAAMSQDEFSPWFDKVVHVLATQVLATEPQALLDEVIGIVEGSRR